MTAAEVGMNLRMVLIRRSRKKQPRTSWLTWTVIVIPQSKWTPRLRRCQLVALQYHQVRRYCNQVDGDINRNSDLDGLSCCTCMSRLDVIHSEMKSTVYRLCYSSGEEGHAHLLFSASAEYSTKRMGPMLPLIFWESVCA